MREEDAVPSMKYTVILQNNLVHMTGDGGKAHPYLS